MFFMTHIFEDRLTWVSEIRKGMGLPISQDTPNPVVNLMTLCKL